MRREPHPSPRPLRRAPTRQGTRALLLIPALAALALAVSCASVEKRGTPADRKAGPEADFVQAVELLNLGERAQARGAFERLLQEARSEEIRPKAYYFLGVIRLLEMNNLAQIQEAKEYFDQYPRLFPGGPYRQNALDISLGLDRILRRGENDQQEILARKRQAGRQQARIRTLEQKILQLEKIYLETEQKRQSVEPSD